MGIDFGKKLKSLRNEKNITQSELAKRIGVSTSAIGMYEQGRREPDARILQKICEVLDTTTDYLLCINTNNDINTIFNNFTNQLKSQDGLMFNGKLLNQEDKIKVMQALKLAFSVIENEEDSNTDIQAENTKQCSDKTNI